MFHYRRVALTLIAAGALAFTTTGVPAAFAADADATQASSSQQAGDDSPSRKALAQGLWPRFPGLPGATAVRMEKPTGPAVAAATAMRCLWPPDRWKMLRCSRCPMPKRSATAP